MEGILGKKSSRTAGELEPVLFQKEQNPQRVVYDVWRGALQPQEREKAQSLGLRYDITKIFPQPLPRPGLDKKELPKTFGHYHKKISNLKSQISNLIDGVEVFEVISGWAWWLLQRYEKNPKIIEEVYLIEGKEKEKMLVPPGFGIVSINPGKEELLTANWIGLEVENDYEDFKKLRGACYYVLESDKGMVEFVKNQNYEKIPELIKLKPREVLELGIVRSKSLVSLLETPEKLEFLKKPEKYKDILTIKDCYTRV